MVVRVAAPAFDPFAGVTDAQLAGLKSPLLAKQVSVAMLVLTDPRYPGLAVRVKAIAQAVLGTIFGFGLMTVADFAFSVIGVVLMVHQFQASNKSAADIAQLVMQTVDFTVFIIGTVLELAGFYLMLPLFFVGLVLAAIETLISFAPWPNDDNSRLTTWAAPYTADGLTMPGAVDALHAWNSYKMQYWPVLCSSSQSDGNSADGSWGQTKFCYPKAPATETTYMLVHGPDQLSSSSLCATNPSLTVGTALDLEACGAASVLYVTSQYSTDPGNPIVVTLRHADSYATGNSIDFRCVATRSTAGSYGWGADEVVSMCAGSTDQQFAMQTNRDGTVTLEPLNPTARCIDSAGGARSAGTHLVSGGCTTSPTQVWQLVPAIAA
jgi:hypothetical protein